MNNPIALINQYIQLISNNPLLSNALSMCKQGNTAEVERIARNLMASQGRNFDDEFRKFMNSMH